MNVTNVKICLLLCEQPWNTHCEFSLAESLIRRHLKWCENTFHVSDLVGHHNPFLVVISFSVCFENMAGWQELEHI